MQSINTGFNSLRTMLPKHEGEKLSKAAILQHTAEYIDTLEQEKTRLLSQLHQLKTLIKSVSNGQQDISELAKHSLVKKIKTEHNSEFNSDSSDEGIHCNVSPIEAFDNVDELKAELIEVRKTVDRERKLRMQLEEQVKALESQLYPERVKEIAQSIQVKMHHGSRHHSSSLHASASETGSLDNSENENELAVASLQDDVIAETIEIETGSCPGSPLTSIGSHQTIVIQQPTSSSNGTSIGSLTPQVIHLDTSTLRVVAAASSGKNASGKSSGQPGAIALPIEVPFMGTIVTASPATMSKNTTTTTIHLTSNSSKGNTLASNTNTCNILGVASSTASGKSAGTGGTVAARVSSVIVSNNNTNSGSSSSNSNSSNSSSSGTNNNNCSNNGNSGSNSNTNANSSNSNSNANNTNNNGNNGNNSSTNSSNSNNSSSSSNNSSSNGKGESGKIANTNGNVANSDGKSVCNSNSNSNKSSASTVSSSSKQSKQATSLPPRHNLETIVEAIRHLEGDHMFKDDDSVAIEVEETVVPLIE